LTPNIVLVVLDATRAANLSCYGYERPTTPHLDRFAEDAVLYERAISPAGWTLPSHASMFTGLYPSSHGAHDQHKRLEPGIPTLAEVLRANGVRTAAICHNPYAGPVTGLDRGFELFNEPRDRRSRLRRVRRVVQRGSRAARRAVGRADSGARATTASARRLIRDFAKARQPFFLFVHYDEAHAPYRLPASADQFLPAGTRMREALRVNQDPWRYLIDPTSMTERDFEVLTGLYDGASNYLDEPFDELVSSLRDARILDSTMVIVTADHGENIGDHGMMAHKYCLYDTLLHVPLIVRFPAGTAAANREPRQVQTLDLMPTVLGMLGLEPPDGARPFEGRDLLSPEGHPYTVAEQSRPDLRRFGERFPGVDVSRFDRALAAIRTDEYKFTWASDGLHELYDLRSDPGETHNVVDDRPDVASALAAQLSPHIDRLTADDTAEQPEFGGAVAERLRSLGYLE
jgi:arylsulfatase A-like enzyme